MFPFFKKRTSLTTLFDEHFVDFHSHLLPGIDDGAKTMEASIALITRMHSYGIKNFITTPHIMENVWENTPTIIQEKLEKVKSELTKQGFNEINIRAAAEYMLDANFNKILKNKELLTIKGNKILIEMSYFNAPINLFETLFDIQVQGYQPILAHPERYHFLQNSFKTFDKLKKSGCLFQLNMLSLTQHYGKGVHLLALKLLKEGYIDYIASDVHNQRHLDLLETINQSKIVNLVKPILKNNSELI